MTNKTMIRKQKNEKNQNIFRDFFYFCALKIKKP